MGLHRKARRNNVWPIDTAGQRKPKATCMRKILAAVTASLLLVAGQAAAAGTTTFRVGDRVSSTAEPGSDFAGVPLPVLLLGASMIVATIVIATNDDGESH